MIEIVANFAGLFFRFSTEVYFVAEFSESEKRKGYNNDQNERKQFIIFLQINNCDV